MAERIQVVTLTRRPGFTFTHGGWSHSDANFCAQQIRLLKGPKKRTADSIAPVVATVTPKETKAAASAVGRVVQSLALLGWLPK